MQHKQDSHVIMLHPVWHKRKKKLMKISATITLVTRTTTATTTTTTTSTTTTTATTSLTTAAALYSSTPCFFLSVHTYTLLSLNSTVQHPVCALFPFQAGELTISPEVVGLVTTLKFDTVEIYGLRRLPSEFAVNGVPVSADNISVVSAHVSCGQYWVCCFEVTWFSASAILLWYRQDSWGNR